MRAGVVLALLALSACGETRTLTPEHVQAAHAALKARNLWSPQSLSLSGAGFVVADYELSNEQAAAAVPLRRFAENHLLAIREALLPHGFTNYRVNINGPSPGTGLVRRYGSARFIDAGGKVEWIKPE